MLGLFGLMTMDNIWNLKYTFLLNNLKRIEKTKMLSTVPQAFKLRLYPHPVEGNTGERSDSELWAEIR